MRTAIPQLSRGKMVKKKTPKNCQLLKGYCVLGAVLDVLHASPLLIFTTALSRSMMTCFIYLFIYLFYLFIFGCVGSSLLHAGFSLVAASGGYSSLWCAGFSQRWLLLLRSMGPRRAGFSSCGMWAQLLRGMCDLPGPGIEPLSPVLAGGFLTTVPPGKSLMTCFRDRENSGSERLCTIRT